MALIPSSPLLEPTKSDRDMDGTSDRVIVAVIETCRKRQDRRLPPTI